MKRILALFLVAATLFTVTACSQGSNVKDDKDQTALETEIPSAEPMGEITQEPTVESTETPTEEPTETPLPEGWYIDPTGIIPPTVEILVPNHSTVDKQRQWCITRIEGKTTLQFWTPEGLVGQWKVPEDMLRAHWMDCAFEAFGQESVFVSAYLAEDIEEIYNGRYLVYYETSDGKYMYFEVTSDWTTSDQWIFATPDGKAVTYAWGNDYYEVQDFGEGASVIADSNVVFCVDGSYLMWEEMQFEKVPLKDKDF